MSKIIQVITDSAVWKSIFRHGLPNTERNRALTTFSNVFLHIQAVKIRRHALKSSYTLGLGVISFVLFLVLIFTGIFLMLYYQPSTDPYNGAYASMKELQYTVSFGVIMRNIHRWAAHAMVVMVFLHLCRVFYTGSYKPPRELNWVMGIGLLIITLLLSFTGYLLPWDQLAYWAIQVGTSIAGSDQIFFEDLGLPAGLALGPKIKFALIGGNQVGQNALLRFYVLHCVILPLMMVLMLAVHFWRVRKDGGLSSPEEDEKYVPPRTETDTQQSGGQGIANRPVWGPDKAKGAFTRGSLKTYGLLGLVKGATFSVEKGPDDTVESWPHLIFRELLLFLGIIVFLLVVSYFFNAPLEEIANPAHPTNPAKAPWYFLWLQEMVSWRIPLPGGGAFIGGILIPTIIVVLLVIWPYVDRKRVGVGRWFAPERKWQIVAFSIGVAAVVFLILKGYYWRGPNWQSLPPWQWLWK